jgi:uncharacterized protein YbjT (DUF2867 family)
MSDYKSFAIWGAGNLGGRIAENLLERKATVIILTRPVCFFALVSLVYDSLSIQESVGNEQNTHLSSKGAEIRPYDVTSANAISGLKDIDVLISTTGFGGLAFQPELVDAAHAASVKLFVPAEFGDTTDGRPEPPLRHKAALREQAATLGLPATTFWTGLWTEFLPYTLDVPHGKITINGSGDAKLSTTSLADIAYFVAEVLTTLPKNQLEDAKFTLQGDVVVSAGLQV